MKLINKVAIVMLGVVSINAFAGGVDRVSFNSNSGNVATYDVWCSNGSHGYVTVSGSYVAWTGPRNGNTYDISVSQAAYNACQ